MELALHLGGPAERLAREMTELEFQDWGRYSRQHLLPFRRLEVYLAQVAWAVARYMGGNAQVPLSEFLIEFGERQDDDFDGEEVDLDALKASVQFSPRKKPAQ